MKKLLVSLTVAMLLLLVVTGIAYATTGVTDPGQQATANYHVVNATLADRFVPTSHSIQGPELGGAIRGMPGLAGAIRGKPVFAGGGGMKPVFAGSGVKPGLGVRPA